jgi:curved DNA-binding protein CbpA
MLIDLYQFKRVISDSIKHTRTSSLSCAYVVQRRFYAEHRSALNHYEILEINKNATVQEIKAAFYRLSKRYHPDVNPNDANAAKTFAIISNAYDILSDPIKRRHYDIEQPYATASQYSDVIYNRTSSYAQRARAHRSTAWQSSYTFSSSNHAKSNRTDNNDFFRQRNAYRMNNESDQHEHFRHSSPKYHENPSNSDRFNRSHYNETTSEQHVNNDKSEDELHNDDSPSLDLFSHFTREKLILYTICSSLGLIGFLCWILLHEMHFQQPTEEFRSRIVQMSQLPARHRLNPSKNGKSQ